MRASIFYLPSIGSRADIEAGYVALRPDLYQPMLRELIEQAQLGVQPHQHDAVDATVRTTNRRAFEECFQIVTSA